MGVKGLWQVLAPIARPINVETLRDKKLAIDSSIWLYQFQSAMRDKNSGRALTNAHILGFLRRICKLLYHGIKPVFVFDGGAPVLKKKTIAGRKSRKRGAGESLTKTAERLLAAQLREAAVRHVQKQKLQEETGEWIDDDAVFLDDDLTEGGEHSRIKRKANTTSDEVSGSLKKKKKYVHRDEYELPHTMESLHSKVHADDPRLATEAELQEFIDDLRPEDLDIDSPLFANLPTEVKYEIVGELRIKSRQVNHRRVESMKLSATPLDFSRAQIENLKQRNDLTQKLLNVTDEIDSSHLSIPVRIAAQKNKEYVLVKSSPEKGGGWILGVKDGEEVCEKRKVIQIDVDEEEDEQSDDEIEFEEVRVDNLQQSPTKSPDKYARQAMAVQAIVKRYVPSPSKSKSRSRPTPSTSVSNQKDLFLEESDDEEMQAAIALSEQEHLELMQRVSFEEIHADNHSRLSSEDRDNSSEPSVTPDMAMMFTSASTRSLFANRADRSQSKTQSERSTPAVQMVRSQNIYEPTSPVAATSQSKIELPLYRPSVSGSRQGTSQNLLLQMQNLGRKVQHGSATPTPTTNKTRLTKTEQNVPASVQIFDDATTEIFDAIPALLPTAERPSISADSKDLNEIGMDDMNFLAGMPGDLLEKIAAKVPQKSEALETEAPVEIVGDEESRDDNPVGGDYLRLERTRNEPAARVHEEITLDQTSLSHRVSSHDEESIFEEISARLTPKTQENATNDILDDIEEVPSIQHVREENVAVDLVDGDALEEEDQPLSDLEEDEEELETRTRMTREQADMGEFYSQLCSRNLEEMREEAEKEIAALTTQRNVDKRNQDEITMQMNQEIQDLLKLFGLPFVIAPMEAEAQCATLFSNGLVDGIITDDSDVFLFGGSRIYKNMFNQAKYVEMYLAGDAERDLVLDRTRLINLAYFLGSDYTEGIKGIGPVMGMDLLKEFPGEDGVKDFKEWWVRVQNGRDTEQDTDSKFKQRFKRLKKDTLYLDNDWPNSEVTDAYLHPTTDTSSESFTWGFVNLDGLRSYLSTHLSWSSKKTDDLLLPLIKRINSRPAAQGTINNYFENAPKGSTSLGSKGKRKTLRVTNEVVRKGRGKRIGRQM